MSAAGSVGAATLGHVVGPEPELVGRRYRMLDLIGRGGMGAVYRAQDLLAGEVALKRLHPGADVPKAADSALTTNPALSATQTVALSLAHEFRTLASLRHRNIISVLDYGFDDNGLPYLTMDLLEQAETIKEAGIAAGRLHDVAAQVELLIQMLEALAYLHRRGILHRDLKPANVLVAHGQVKLLDFGIAIDRDQVSRAVRAGTPGYLAPEVLRGMPASERSDLYAVGLIAREWYLERGELPATRDLRTGDETTEFLGDAPPPSASRPDARSTSPRGAGDEALSSMALPGAVPAALAPVLDRLLASDPRGRYASADEVIHALCAATGQPVPVETGAMRESFLQAARFVGRESEQKQLSQVLDEAIAGRGSAWLLGGESGVGKSRLLDELRALAQVRGALVLRGQSVSEGASPYHPWRSVLRWLTILVELTDLEASVLKPHVPDIERVLGRAVAAPAALDVEVEQARLYAVVEDIFARQRQPMVVLLEDLHWAGSETLRLLGRLMGLVSRVPVLLLGTFRDDERPDLATLLPGARVLKLNRLVEADVARLTESMIGEAGREPHLLEALQRETEGNPFFLVEVLRELAEDAGRLDRIIEATMPGPAPGQGPWFARGVRQVVQRRLARIPPSVRPLLEVAAVLGRQLDLKLLGAIDSVGNQGARADLERWLLEAAAAAMLEVAEGRWRFSHDKLREGLLAELPPLARAPLHLRAAEAIEAVYSDAPEHVPALAFHFAEAGDTVKEAIYVERAGELALHAGACAESTTMLHRALALVEDQVAAAQTASAASSSRLHAGLQSLGWRSRQTRGDSLRRARRLGHIQALLAEAQYQLGDIDQCRVHAEHALRHFGHPMPAAQPAWLGGTLREVLMRALQSTQPSAFAEDVPETREALHQVGRLQTRLSDVFIYQQQPLPILWTGLRTLNLCEPAGPSPVLARGYAQMAVVAGTMPLHRLAEAWSRRAIAVASQAGNPVDVAFVLSRQAVCCAYRGRWRDVDEQLVKATAIVDGLGDFRLAEECRSLRALVTHYQGDFERCLPLWAWVERSAGRRGAAQMELLGPLGRASAIVRLGRAGEAIALIEAALPRLKQQGGGFDVNVYGALALAHLRRGDATAARAAAARVLDSVAAARPVAHFTHLGVSMLADACLTLWEQAVGTPDAGAMAAAAQKACKGVRTFAKVFPFGEPYALLTEGSAAWLAGHPKRARAAWKRCIAAAQRLSMPYEEGRAHLEIGRRLPAGDPERRHHFDRAAAILDPLGAVDDLALADHPVTPAN